MNAERVELNIRRRWQVDDAETSFASVPVNCQTQERSARRKRPFAARSRTGTIAQARVRRLSAEGVRSVPPPPADLPVQADRQDLLAPMTSTTRCRTAASLT